MVTLYVSLKFSVTTTYFQLSYSHWTFVTSCSRSPFIQPSSCLSVISFTTKRSVRPNLHPRRFARLPYGNKPNGKADCWSSAYTVLNSFFNRPFLLKMCANGGSATRCTDSRREKRDSDDYLRPVVGPIYLIDRDGATEHVTYLGADQPVAMRRGRLPTPSVRNSGMVSRWHLNLSKVLLLHFYLLSESFLITAVGSGLLIIIASAVVTLVCLKRKGYSKQVVEPHE